MKPGHQYKTPEHIRAYNKAHYAKHHGRKAAWRDDGPHRECIKCKERKLRELEFNKLRHGRLGYMAECKTCNNKRAKGAAPSWTKLTRAQYQTYVREGLCHICGLNKPRMAVDHCHATQEKRGVLCHSCNMGLGHFQDRADLLNKAAAYLRR